MQTLPPRCPRLALTLNSNWRLCAQLLLSKFGLHGAADRACVGVKLAGAGRD
eukprot:CAMPEP_0171214418 /NCGR_PEP_ID=MMETSP0790-20130122/31147_1 /TAXON_ID=2925 /ORGANISM="Alexandrium catenella, Strain OF101" /LENGTH=51 /DNA_ID=CAMNT_0011680151 /DNA_START=373 /DNA_END=525 /DNA_ORIENTATION=+